MPNLKPLKINTELYEPKIPKQQSKKIQTLYDQGTQLLLDNKLVDSLICFHQVISISPDHFGAHYLSSVIYLRSNNIPAAFESIEIAVTLDPNNEEANKNHVHIALKLGRIDTALKAFKRAMSVTQNKSELHVRFTASVKISPNTDEAINVVTVLLETIVDERQCFNLVAKLIRAVQLNDNSPILSLFAHKARSCGILGSKIYDDCCQLLNELGFLLEQPKHITKAIFDNVSLVWMIHALQEGHYDAALNLERNAYSEYTKQVDTETHWRDYFGAITPAMEKAGREFAKSSTELAREIISPDKPIVGFFLHTAGKLAHTDVLISLLEGYAQCETKPFTAQIYILEGQNIELEQIFNNLGVAVFYQSSDNKRIQAPANRLLRLKQVLHENQVDVLTWISSGMYMTFALAMRLAPVQLWWSMKFHGIESNDIDGYFANGSYEKIKVINGKNWQVIHNAITHLYDPAQTPIALSIRKKLNQADCIVGCLGREEKVDSVDYLSAIAVILRARPRTLFVWSGRKYLPSIKNKMLALGIENQCIFADWVITKAYAQVFDIYLDTFPMGGGHTVFQSMAAGKPIVMRSSKEAFESGVPMHISPVFNGNTGSKEEQDDVKNIFSFRGESLYLCADSDEAYVQAAIKLIDDHDFRHKVGQAGKQFVERHISDAGKMMQSFTDNVFTVINKKIQE